MRGFFVVATILSFPFAASADPMDITLSRLSYPVEVNASNAINLDTNGNGFPDAEEPATLGMACGTLGGDRCAPHQWAFRNLVAQLGRVFAPKLLAPAETLGYNGFYIGLESNLVPIDSDASYWRYGTEGTRAAHDAGVLPQDRDPDSFLYMPTFHVRKGLPFGAEVGTSMSYLAGSELVGLGLDVKVSPFEGFFEGVGYLPAVAVRGAVNRLTGDDELNLTVVGVDVSISKSFGAWGQIEITPYGGWQHQWVITDTEVVDFTPERDAWSELEPRWNPFARCLSTDGAREARSCEAGEDPATDGCINLSDVDLSTPTGQTEANNQCTDAEDENGQAVSGHWEADWEQGASGDPDDYNNNGVFDRETMQNERAFGGIRVIWEHLSVTGEFSMDLTQYETVEAPKQWGVSLGIGLDW